jgi:membrane protein
VSHEGGWHRSPWGIVRRTLEAAFEDNIPFLASALSFDLLLTAIPFLVLLLALVGYLVQHQITTHQIQLHDLLQRFIPMRSDGRETEVFAQVERALGQVVVHRTRLTLFGVPLFLWFSTRMFGGLRAALNEVFDTDERRPWPVAKLLDLAMVLVTWALLLASALLPALELRQGNQLTGLFVIDWIWRFGLETTAFAFAASLFFLIFKMLPSRRIPWRTALVAAVFCALAFEVAKRLYTLYLSRFVTFDRVASDANFVAFFLFLLWVYYTAYVFLLGGEVAETYDLIQMRRAQGVALG